MTSPIKIMIKYPKRSLFAAAVSGTALHYTYDYTVTNDLMKISSKQAARLGDERLKNPKGEVRHITVILNPVAGKRKCKKLYQKWSEPLFHLAGIKVSLIETQSPKQAYDLMKIMSNCDGVAIVGGDGTVHDALNGLLHRPDAQKAVRDYPIGIIPTGQYNSIARYIHQGFFKYRNQKEFVINATMKVVDSVQTKFDVIKIDPLDDELKGQQKSVYALRDIRYGIYQDNFYKLSGYHMYETYIKPIWLRIKRVTGSKKFVEPKINSISYTRPCEGCSKCFERHRLPTNSESNSGAEQSSQSANRRWWGMLAPVSKNGSQPSDDEKKELELSKRENEKCGKWITLGDVMDVTDFRACMMGDKQVRLSLARNREYSPSDVRETQDVRLRVEKHIDTEMKLASQKKPQVAASSQEVEPSGEPVDEDKADKKSEEEEKKPVQFLIDGQATQAHSVEITAIGKAVTIFSGNPRIHF